MSWEPEIGELKRRNGIAALWRAGEQLQQGTRRILSESGLEGKIDCAGLPPWTTLRCAAASAEESLLWRSLFQQEAIKRGILTHGNHMLSLAHTPEVIDATLAAYREIFPILADAIAHGDVAQRLEGPPIQPILRQ